jgi:general secretion pathway protein A
MYGWFYGFSEEPFNVNPDPQFLFLSPTHQQALNLLINGIKEREGFVVLLGDLGTGKTSLIQYLLNILDKDTKAIVFYHPPRTFEELLEDVLQELGVPLPTPNKVSLVRVLKDYLRTLTQDETLALIFDEAQDFRQEVLEELRFLPIPEKVQVLFVGQPEFHAKLGLDNFKELRQRNSAMGHLRALKEEECKLYIAHRLETVEGDINKVFTPKAVSLICQHSRGNPRTINVLCDNAFLIGYGLSKKQIDSSIMKEVLEDLDFISSEEEEGWPPEEGLKLRPPARRTKGSLFRKISYSLAALVGVGAIILLGRIFWKGPVEELGPKFPIQPPSLKEGIALIPSVVNPDLAPQGALPSETARKPRPPAAEPESPPSVAPSREELKPSDPSPPTTGKRATPAPAPVDKPAALVRAPDSKPEQKGMVSKPMPAALPPAPAGKVEAAGKGTVVVKEGDSIYFIALRTYKVANTSIVDQILVANPQIANPNKLPASQNIRLPEIDEETLIFTSPDGSHQVRLGTFLKPEYSAFLEGQPALKGRKTKIIPQKLSSGETWYRVVAGGFSTREEALGVVADLRRNGLSPYFPGFRKKG